MEKLPVIERWKVISMKAVRDSLPSRAQVYHFLENPKGRAANLFQVFVVLLILSSVATVGVDFLDPIRYEQHKRAFEVLNNIVLAVFTIEFAIRLFTAPNRRKFLRKPNSIVDIMAIAPSYLEIILPLLVDIQALRILRLLRLARLLRLFKLFRYSSFFKKVFGFHGTILEKILPVLAMLTILKVIIWWLESQHLWFSNIDLNGLFTTIGFALGIILTQKIQVSYGKFITVEEAISRIYGNLQTLSSLFIEKSQQGQKKIIKNWAVMFLNLLNDEQGDNAMLHPQNTALYRAVSSVEEQPGELAVVCGDIIKDASFCLGKKSRLTPRAYDQMLQQQTVLYLILMAVFIPGLVGLISLIIATYVLYGMYELTVDIDSIIGGSHNLISVDLDELESIANNKELRSKS
jgi:hypothetical protein